MPGEPRGPAPRSRRNRKRLGLVVARVADGHAVGAQSRGAAPVEEPRSAPRAPASSMDDRCRCVPRRGRRLDSHGMDRRKAVGKVTAERLVLVGGAAAQPMVEVREAGQARSPPAGASSLRTDGQRDRVGAAGQADDHPAIRAGAGSAGRWCAERARPGRAWPTLSRRVRVGIVARWKPEAGRLRAARLPAEHGAGAGT